MIGVLPILLLYIQHVYFHDYLFHILLICCLNVVIIVKFCWFTTIKEACLLNDFFGFFEVEMWHFFNFFTIVAGDIYLMALRMPGLRQSSTGRGQKVGTSDCLGVGCPQRWKFLGSIFSSTPCASSLVVRMAAIYLLTLSTILYQPAALCPRRKPFHANYFSSSTVTERSVPFGQSNLYLFF